MRWTDEMELPECEELLSVMVHGQSISLQEFQHSEASVKSTRYRVSVGNLFGSQSIHIKHLRDAVISVNKIRDHLYRNDEREKEGKKPKLLDPAKLPGFYFREPREEKKDQYDVEGNPKDGNPKDER